MPVLYFDNFRGFDTTYLPLKDINFFVGENSTGKTSVLKLIGIISSTAFWHYQQFYTKEISFGNFSDIVTSVEQKNYFEVAILEEPTGDQTHPSAIKFRLIEKDNLPYIKEICFVFDGINVQVSIEGNSYKYRYAVLSDESFNNENKEVYFKEWINTNGLTDSPFEKIDTEIVGITSILFQLQTIISAFIGRQVRFKRLSSLNDAIWFDPSREGPKNTYDAYDYSYNAQGLHTPYMLKRLLKDKLIDEESRNKFKTILRRFGEDSALFDDIDVNVLGEKDLAPFEIQVTLNGKVRNINNAGYGISQALPLIIEALANPPQKKWYAIQQPEVHLHPKAQAALGDFIYKSNSRDDQKFLIETHSDYIIDRFRIRIKRAFKEKVPVNTAGIGQVIFFLRGENGNELHLINILKDGSYPVEQPKEFKEFFIKEQLQLIKI